MPDDVTFERASPWRRAMRSLAATGPGSWLFARLLHHVDRATFRSSRGRQTLTSLVTGLPVVMVTTTGARSGTRRTVPLLGVPTDDGLVIVASNYGQHHHPAWYHNLRADPTGEVTVDDSAWPFRAILAEGPQRERIWQQCLEVYPGFAVYERRAAHRHIGVFVLEPA